jgi:dTDP-glucose 4,6-dehydratase
MLLTQFEQSGGLIVDLSDKTVAVTGAGGFIGSHLIDYLFSRVGRLIALMHYNSLGDLELLRFLPEERLKAIDMVYIDIADPHLMISSLTDVDVVLHLAANISIPYSYQAPYSFAQMNVMGSLNVLEAARRAGSERIVYVSSSEVYGSAQKIPIDESHPLNPQSVYAASKVGGESLALGYYKSFDSPVTIVRPFNTYGPRQSARAIIPTIISQALWRDKVELGNLETKRDLNYVSDTVRGMALAAQVDDAVGQTLNLGTGSSVSICSLVDHIISIIGRDVEIVQRPERMRPPASEVDILESDPRLAEKIIGWKSEIDLESGLKATIDFIRDNKDLYRPEVYSI